MDRNKQNLWNVAAGWTWVVSPSTVNQFNAQFITFTHDNQYPACPLPTTYLGVNLGVDNWNEAELENKFISPLIVFVGFDNERFAYFLERELRGVVGDYELMGRVDGMIASGFRNPHQPY